MTFDSTLTLCMLGNFYMLLSSSADFFQINFCDTGTLSECQTIWIQIRTDVESVLIWLQTVCKEYKQTAKVAIIKQVGNPLEKGHLSKYKLAKFHARIIAVCLSLQCVHPCSVFIFAVCSSLQFVHPSSVFILAVCLS